MRTKHWTSVSYLYAHIVLLCNTFYRYKKKSVGAVIENHILPNRNRFILDTVSIEMFLIGKCSIEMFLEVIVMCCLERKR